MCRFLNGMLQNSFPCKKSAKYVVWWENWHIKVFKKGIHNLCIINITWDWSPGFYKSWRGGAADETSHWPEKVTWEGFEKTRWPSYRLQIQAEESGESLYSCPFSVWELIALFDSGRRNKQPCCHLFQWSTSPEDGTISPHTRLALSSSIGGSFGVPPWNENTWSLLLYFNRF